jgi:hypothetical protein
LEGADVMQVEVGIAGMTRHEGCSCVRFISSALGVTFYWWKAGPMGGHCYQVEIAV